MVRNRKSSKADAAPPAASAPVVVESARGRRAARVFLMVAGGLAAPCLALAAFFMTNSGSADKPARPSAAQSGPVTRTSAPGGTGSVAGHSAVPATTTTTTAPGPVATPPRDPFAPLVSTAPATPGK